MAKTRQENRGTLRRIMGIGDRTGETMPTKYLAAAGRRIHPPPEIEEQKQLAQYLDALGLLWFHAPNEGRRTYANAASLRACGMKAGVPDFVIISRPPARPNCHGVAIELKRERGGKVSKAQQVWIDALLEEGWYAFTARGADDAIKQLLMLGYRCAR